MKSSFKTIVKIFGNNTGIVVPEANLLELQAGKKPSVKVQVNDYEFQSSVASMNGQFLISFSKAHRELSGIKGNDEVFVTLILETGVRTVNLPDYFKELLEQNGILDVFEAQSYSNRKEMVRQVVDSKKEDTRTKRMNQIVKDLKLFLTK